MLVNSIALRKPKLAALVEYDETRSLRPQTRIRGNSNYKAQETPLQKSICQEKYKIIFFLILGTQ